MGREPGDAYQLKRREKETRHRRDATVWSLVVNRVEVVTDKHIRVREFIRYGDKHQAGLPVGCVVESKRGAR